MFDRVEITVKAGDGGYGVVSFRREKFIPLGGPDGGDGGYGGDVVLKADSGVASLLRSRQRGVYRAGDGQDGRGRKKHGRSGDDLILTVALGTVVIDKALMADEAVIADLEQPGQVVAAKGGRGGWGNTHFVSSTNQAPQIAQQGEVGQEKSIILELKLIADVGIIGYPNVGKSSLLAAASAAKPRIASYPFTTLEPVLGVAEVGQRSFVLAEVPGLIQDAHLGRGLGHDFLRHVVRTRVLIHLIDGGSASPVEDMVRVNSELKLFDSALAQKPQLVVVNKIDLPEVQARLAATREAFGQVGIGPLFISAATGQGVAELMVKTSEMLERVTAREKAGVKIARKVFRPKPRERAVTVHREGGMFIVVAPELERITAGTDITSPEARRQLQGQLARWGVVRALKKAGVKPGDRVRCGRLEWEW